MAIVASIVGAILLRFPYIAYVGYAVSVLVFLYLIKKDEASAYKLSWVIIVMTFPVVGGVIYLLYGKVHPARQKISAHIEEHALIAKLLDSDGNLPFVNQVQCGRMYSLLQYIRSSSSYHAYQNTETKYYPIGELKFSDMLDELSKAEKFIFLEYFIIKKSQMWDDILEILEQKAAEGVEVRLIIDDFGSHRLFVNKYIKALRTKGIKVMRFSPIKPFLAAFMNHRDHRKIMVVDGHTAFVGGLNISDEYININSKFGVWKDTAIRLKGDGVWSFTLMFIEMWDTFCKTEERINNHAFYRMSMEEQNMRDMLSSPTKTDGFIVPYGDSPLDNEQLGENIYIDILNQSERYVYIFTPYLIISEKMIHALQMTARRGVDVRIIMPGIPDKKIIYRLSRSYYNCLLEAGVRIFEYAPGFLHAKSFVCDDEVAVVGTINLDYRSLYLHFECATLLYHTSSIQDIKADAIQTIAESREVSMKASSWHDMLDAVLHLFAPLL